MSGRDSITSQTEHLQLKYVGTGHPDTNKLYVNQAVELFSIRAAADLLKPFLPQLLFIVSEWMVNIHRDTIASYMGHTGLLAYFAVALNESQGRVKHNLMQKMLAPIGPPPIQGTFYDMSLLYYAFSYNVLQQRTKTMRTSVLHHLILFL